MKPDTFDFEPSFFSCYTSTLSTILSFSSIAFKQTQKTVSVWKTSME